MHGKRMHSLKINNLQICLQDSKSGIRFGVSWVRIPPFPPGTFEIQRVSVPALPVFLSSFPDIFPLWREYDMSLSILLLCSCI